jgi:hypothetical protein
MGTQGELRTAGLAALLTAALLSAALFLVGGGPPSEHGSAVLTWHAENVTAVKVGSLLWLLAMLGLVVFGVSFREAVWASVADRSWTTILFVQGATVFATVAVASAAIGWSLAHQAAAGSIAAELAGTVWALEQTLLRFASWGFTVPLAVAGVAMYRHSLLGQLCAVAAVLVAAALLVPLTWSVALHAFPAWLLLAATTLLVPTFTRARTPQPLRRP